MATTSSTELAQLGEILNVDSDGTVTISGVIVSSNIGTSGSPVTGTFTDLTVTGNLTVEGTTTTINSSNLSVDDINITIADGAATAGAADGAGITIAGANATLTYEASSDAFALNKPLSTTTNVLSNYSTDELTEGSNLYYTTVRATTDARAAVSANGGLTYNSSTGVFSVPASGVAAGTYGSGSLVPVITVDEYGFVDSVGTVSVAGVSSFGYNTSSGVLTIGTADGSSYTATVTLDPFSTTNLTEGTNQYFTTARARSAITVVDNGGDGALSYNSTNGTISYTGPTDAEVRAHFSAAGDLSYNSATGQFSVTTYKDVDARTAISANDAGGDGSFSYNSSTGVFTYTGPSAAETRAHFTGGTGVTITDGSVAIGQDVSTTADVVFGSLETTNGLVVGGNLQVNGTTTTVNSQNLAIDDNMIYLNQVESAGSPTIIADLGWAANYNDDGTYAHTGFFRDATDNTYKIYQGYTPEPDAALEINTGHASFQLAPLAVSTISGQYLGFDSDFSAKSTSDLTEGTNQYFTTARARSSVSGGTGVTYSSSTGVIEIGQAVATTSNVTFASVTATTGNITTVDLGNWTVSEDGSGNLLFATGGSTKMRLDATGNLDVVGNVNSNAVI